MFSVRCHVVTSYLAMVSVGYRVVASYLTMVSVRYVVVANYDDPIIIERATIRVPDDAHFSICLFDSSGYFGLKPKSMTKKIVHCSYFH